MIILKGTGIFKDISFGTLSIRKNKNENVQKYTVSDSAQELQKYYGAKETAIKQIRGLYEKSLNDFGASEAEIFAVHEMMIKDKDYENTIEDLITNHKFNAEYAVWEASRKFSEIFTNMNDPYMSERAADVKDISDRIINCLCNNKSSDSHNCENIVVAAYDLTPSEVSELDRTKVKGLILAQGSACSHASIIANVLKIPSVVGIGKQIDEKFDGAKVAIDSFSGTVYIDPDLETIKNLEKKKKEHEMQVQLLKELKGKENITLDGQKIKIYANINKPEELDDALENDAGGIGLFRSEFLYLGRSSYPSEDEQFEVYKEIAQKADGKEMVIRTFDVGSDKRAEYFNLPQEHNPALGCRGVRVYSNHSQAIITQLKAIFRASLFGNICIMFPMVVSLDEVKALKEYIKQAKKELSEKNIVFSDKVQIGAMIETPAAALISDELAKEVDFFSIGTNDLTQYTLAVDRQNQSVSHICSNHHKALLKLIAMTVKNAHKNGIWVGICGEMAADETLLETFLAMKVDEISMSPSMILNMRKKVLETNISAIRDKILEKL